MSYRLVFGASGYIGSHLAPYLASRGLSVRATSRNVEVIEAREWQDVALAEADALQPESLDSVLEDVDDLTYKEIMQQYAELVGKSTRIIPVRVLTPRLSSY